MSIAELRKLPAEEKLKIIEALWDDLAADPGALEMPEWHKDALREAESAVAEGTAEFVDWEVAKQRLRRQTAPGECD